MGRAERVLFFSLRADRRAGGAHALDIRRAGLAHGFLPLHPHLPFLRVKDYLGYLALRAGVGLVGMLPLAVARKLGEIYGWFWHLAAGGRRRMAERHMRRVLGAGADTKAAGKAVMVSYGRYWTEAFWVRARRVPEIRSHTNVDGLELLVTAAGRRNGDGLRSAPCRELGGGGSGRHRCRHPGGRSGRATRAISGSLTGSQP